MKIGLFILLLLTLLVLYRVFALRQRRQAGGGRQPGTQESLMSAQKAAALLGLEGQFSQQDIIDAHRRLMQKVHPDKGGSVALAQELNEAKRVLLRHNRP